MDPVQSNDGGDFWRLMIFDFYVHFMHKNSFVKEKFVIDWYLHIHVVPPVASHNQYYPIII